MKHSVMRVFGLVLAAVLLAAVPARSQDIDLELVMPGTAFGPGSLFYANLDVSNSGGTLEAAQVYVALTVGTGDFWFWPGWVHYPSSIDWHTMDITGGHLETLEILPQFYWPSGAGSCSYAAFIAAVLHSGALVSNVPVYNFSWYEETPPTPPPTNRLQPSDLTYLGAFRLPGGDTPPLTFAYGGNAMTFNPDGNPGGSGDVLPGSLFITGHDRQAWGGLPDGDQVAEITIPEPVVAASPEGLPVAAFVQDFHNVFAGHFTELDEIPRVGMAYLDRPETGPLLHIGWGQHMPPDTPPATHAWIGTDLSNPSFQGTWYIGNRDFSSVNGYMFTIPPAWAARYSSNRLLATGRFKDGGWSGMGPALFAYQPWQSGGAPYPAGTHLNETTLLLYQDSYTSEDIVRCMTGYQHPDEWEGGEWIERASGRTAVLFCGTKSVGTKYWYGYINPAGPNIPCVDADVTDFTTCRMADGSPCPPEDFTGCCDPDLGNCISLRGWWSTHFDGSIIFYDPAQLAQVATGAIHSWEPQPYAMLDIDEVLYLNPSATDLEMLGWGDQRRYRIGDMAYDPAGGLLYVLELFADGAKPVVHVWEVE